MGDPVVRAFPVFYNNKKVAEAHSNDVTINGQRTAVYGAEGWLAAARGAVSLDISVQYIIPVGGTSVDFITDTVLQNDIDVGIPVAGKILRRTMAITQNQMKGNTQTGVVDGTCHFIGGPPQVT